MIRAFCDHRNQVIVPTEQGWEDGYGTEGNSSYAGRFNTAGCAAETGIPTVCKVGHTDTHSHPEPKLIKKIKNATKNM